MKIEIGKTYWTVHETFVKVRDIPFDDFYEGEIVAGFGAGAWYAAHRASLLEEAVVWPDGKLQRATSLTARDIYAWGMCVSDGQGDVLANALLDTLSEPQMQRLEAEFDAWLGEPLHTLTAVEVERRALQFRDAVAEALVEAMAFEDTVEALVEAVVFEEPASFNGWTTGDVMTYLERFGDVQDYHMPGEWNVCRGALFNVDVTFDDNAWWTNLTDSDGDALDFESAPNGWTAPTLPEVMRLTVQGWRDLVALSDPEPVVDAGPSQCPHGNHTGSPCPLCLNMRHIGTGDMGQRNLLGGGWGGRDD